MLVVWRGEDGDSAGITGQLFSPLGKIQGGSFVVNQITTGVQTLPSISTDPNGDFVVVWLTPERIMARGVQADGTPAGNDFQVTSAPVRDPAPHLGFDAAGNSVVLFASQQGTVRLFEGRLSDSQGIETGEFVVESLDYEFYPTLRRTNFGLAVNQNGEFVVTTSTSGLGLFGGIYIYHSNALRRFAADGTGIDSFGISSARSKADAAYAPNGDLIVVASGYLQVYGRRFAADGNDLGQFTVGPVEFQDYPYGASTALAFDPHGNFAVVWKDYSVPNKVKGQFFSADGEPQGDLFIATTSEKGEKLRPAVVASEAGFLVMWNTQSPPSLQGRWFQTHLLFADGFESGDLGAWDSTLTAP